MAALTGTLHLTAAHLAQVNQPSTDVASGTAGSVGGGGSRNDDRQLSGEFRNYANGVTRLILGSATSRTQTFALRALTPYQVQVVDSLMGKTCVFRDTYGRKVFGSFIETSKTDIPLSDTPGHAGSLLTDVAITFVSITYDEEV